MSSRLNPYLTFNGNARQAMEFYADVFGGNLVLNTFAEFGATDSPDADRTMHAMLETDAGDGDLLRGYWEKLSAGGTITMPMQKQAWGDEFGMCVDKFGVPWMVNISQART